MAEKLNQVSIWSSFENLVEEAEHRFFEHDYEGAVKTWENYAQITGAPVWQKAASDMRQLISHYLNAQISDPQQLFDAWIFLRQQMNKNQLSSYAYHIMQRLYSLFSAAAQNLRDINSAVRAF